MPEKGREMTPKQVAKLLKAHIGTIYRWILSGRLKAWRRAGGRYIVYEEDARAVIAPAPTPWK